MTLKTFLMDCVYKGLVDINPTQNKTSKLLMVFEV